MVHFEAWTSLWRLSITSQPSSPSLSPGKRVMYNQTFSYGWHLQGSNRKLDFFFSSSLAMKFFKSYSKSGKTLKNFDYRVSPAQKNGWDSEGPHAKPGGEFGNDCSVWQLHQKWSSIKNSCHLKSAQAAMAKYYGLGGLNNRNLFPYSSGGNKAQSKALAGLISHGTSPWLAGGVFSLSPHMVSPLSLCIPGISPSSYKVISHIGLGPTFMTFVISVNTLSPNTVIF